MTAALNSALPPATSPPYQIDPVSVHVSAYLKVQCKRYAPGAFARLLRGIKSSELTKIESLSPARYVLCTSCQLNPDQKDKEIERWAERPQEFNEVRYVWQAAVRAIDADPQGAHWEDQIRAALVKRTKELSAAIPLDWSAEEISEAADDLQLVVSDLGDELTVTLRLLREREEDARRPEDEDDRTEVRLANRYRSRGRSEIEADVDNIFDGLLEQLDALPDDDAALIHDDGRLSTTSPSPR